MQIFKQGEMKLIVRPSEDGATIAGLTVTCAIQRISDGQWWNGTTNVWGVAKVDNTTVYDSDIGYIYEDADLVENGEFISVFECADVNYPFEVSDHFQMTNIPETTLSEIQHSTYGLNALQSILNLIKAKTDNLPIDPASESQAAIYASSIISEVDGNESLLNTVIGHLIAMKGSGWVDETLVTIQAAVNEINIETDDITAIKGQTDKLLFNGSNHILAEVQNQVDLLSGTITTIAAACESAIAAIHGTGAYDTPIDAGQVTQIINALLAEMDAQLTALDVARQTTLLSQVAKGSALVPTSVRVGDVVTLVKGNTYEDLEFIVGDDFKSYLDGTWDIFLAVTDRTAGLVIDKQGAVVSQADAIVGFTLESADTDIGVRDNYKYQVILIKGLDKKTPMYGRMEVLNTLK